MNLKLLKNKNFSLFVFGQSTSILGTKFLNVALALYVLKITGEAGKFASILALGIIPNIIFGPIAGTIVDKIDRKKMLISMDFLRGFFAILLFAFSFISDIDLKLIYLIVIFYAICQVFFSPAFVTILPSVVRREELIDANTLQKTSNEIVLAISPFLGALIFGLYGIPIILFIDGLTYLISALAEIFIKIPARDFNSKEDTFLKEIVAGFKVVFEDIRITSLICNGILTHLFLAPFVLIGFPYLIINVLSGQDIDYGIVESIATLGSILAVFVIGFAKKKMNIAKCIGVGIIGMIVFVLTILPLSNDFVISLLSNNSSAIKMFFGFSIFILYLSFGFYGVFYVTFYQTTINQNKLGRYVALQGLFFSVARLFGLKMYGFLFDQYNLIIPILVLGLGMLLKVFVHLPFIRETNRLDCSQRKLKGSSI